MAETHNDRWIKLGSIRKGKKGNNYVTLGTAKSKFEPVNVEVTVTDLSGKVLAKVMNPNFNAQNPRKRNGITAEQAAKIPEYILAELSLAPAKKD